MTIRLITFKTEISAYVLNNSLEIRKDLLEELKKQAKQLLRRRILKNFEYF
jgi:hypothetical protein